MQASLRKLVPTVLALAALPLASASAAPVVDATTYPMADVGSNSQLVAGSDGNVYVAREGAGLGEVVNAPVTHTTIFNAGNFPAGVLGSPTGGIAATPGFVWLSQSPAGVQPLVKIPVNADGSGADVTTATGVAVTGLTAGATAMTTGPDGNIWVAIATKVLRIPPANPAGVQSFAVPTVTPKGLTSSPDGTLWLADQNGSMFNIRVDGTYTEYPVADTAPQYVAASTSGRVLFSSPASVPPNRLGLLSPGGTAMVIDRPIPADPFGVAFGGDGAFWVAMFAGGRLDRVTTDGQITSLTVPSIVNSQGPRQVLATGTALWVTLQNNDPAQSKIVRVTGVEPAPVATAPVTPVAPIVTAPAKDTTPPKLTSLKLNHAKITAGAASVKVTFRLSEQARVRVLVERRKGGRRKGKKCVAPTRALRRAKACTRYVRITSKSPPLMAGRNSISITTRRWAAGAYRFTITATDNAGNVTKRVARNLTVAKKKPRKK